jgi:ribosomal protein S18 acetylase RimI-like enzyme
MSYIQTDTSDEALITVTRANMGDLFRLISSATPEEHFENEKFTRWYTPLPHPWFNGVLSTKPFEAADEAFIVETIQYFRAKGIHSFTWWMDPPLQASDWKAALSKHGFGFDHDTPGMALDLHMLNESQPPVEGLEIRETTDSESVRVWANVFTIGYGLPPDWEDRVFDLWSKLDNDSQVRNYIGYLNGKPVSTACLILGGGAAGIYSVATLPEARGKGIGAALTLKPLQDARDMGYRIGTLQSSDMGFNIYKKLGFRHLCQIECFYLSLQ